MCVKKNTINYIFLLIMISLALAALSSCKKFLDTDVQGIQTSEQFFNTQQQLNSALNSVYAVLNSPNLYGDHLLGRMGLDADQGFSSKVSDLTDVGGYDVKSDDPKILGFWQTLYTGITRANLVLENIDKPVMDNTARAKIKGEALFLRGYYHFLLVSNFGDVPLVMKSALTSTEPYPPRTPAVQVYNQILTDMETAADLLEDINAVNYSGRVTKSAAWGIIARVSLQMAGEPINDHSKYEKARIYAKKVIDAAAGHALNTSFEQIFINYAQDKYEIKESIWEVEFWSDASTNNNSMPGLVGVNNGIKQSADPNIGFAAGYVHPTAKLFNLYDETDRRRDWSIANFYYEGNPAAKINWSAGEIYQRNAAKFRREYETVFPKLNGRTPQNFPLLRYADVLLMYAEAVNETNGAPTPEIVNMINTIRKRSIILLNTGKLKQVTITNGGKSFATPPLVVISGGGGSGAKATATIAAGQITTITITDGGSGYTSPPSVTFFGSGTGAAATTTIYTADEINLTPAQIANKDSFLIALQEERTRELAFELLRKADLLRWGIFLPQMKEVLNSLPATSTLPEVEAARKIYTNVSARDVVWPIPQQEIRLNNKLIQNTGW